MKITLQTYRVNTQAPAGPMRLVYERHYEDLIEGLRGWLNAQLDFSIDRIKIQIEKGPLS